MTDSEILWIRDEMFPGHGAPFDALAFGRSVAMQAAAQERARCAGLCDAAKAAIWELHDPSVKQAAENVCDNLAARMRGA